MLITSTHYHQEKYINTAIVSGQSRLLKNCFLCHAQIIITIITKSILFHREQKDKGEDHITYAAAGGGNDKVK